MALEPYPVDYRQSQFEAPGPVNGGMRWRSDGFADFLRRNRDPFNKDGDEPSREAAPPAPASRPVAAHGPFITFTPPAEARVGEEYVVQAKAFDPNVNGFNWFFKKDCCPPGMAVDRYGGEIRWTPSEGGHYEVTLGCGTVHGRIAYVTWTVCVRKAAAVRTVVPSPRFQCAVRRKASILRAPRLRCIAWRRARRHACPSARAAAPPDTVHPVARVLRI